jgi:hypothetical protein
MSIKGYISAQAGIQHSEYVRVFTRILALAPPNATSTQKSLHEKIRNDYLLYIKKALKNPASIDTSFRRILLARLNKLHNEDYYSERLFDPRLARKIINDIENNDGLLLAEFPTLEDQSNFIAKIEEDKILSQSRDNFIPFPVKTGNFIEKINRVNHYHPTRALLSECIDLGTASFMNQEWREAVRYFNLAIAWLNSALSTEKDHPKIHADLTCRIAACCFNEGMNEIENKKPYLAMLKCGEAYDVIQSIHPAAIDFTIKKLINQYHYMHLKTINTYAVANLSDIKLLQTTANFIHAENGKFFPLELELIRLLVKATYFQVKTSLVNGEFDNVIFDLSFAFQKNYEALIACNYPVEKNADRMLGRFLAVSYAVAAQRILSSDRSEALQLYCNALTTSFCAESFDLDIYHNIINLILNTFNSQELETINQIIETYYEKYPQIADAFHPLKFSFRLNYTRAYLTSKEDSSEKTLELLGKAAFYFCQFEATYYFTHREKNTLAVIKASIYRSIAILHYKIGERAIDTNLGETVINFHRSLAALSIIPSTHATPETVVALGAIKEGLRCALEDYFSCCLLDVNFGDHIAFVKSLLFTVVNPVYKDIYVSAWLNGAIKRASQLQLQHAYAQAFEYFQEAEAAWSQLSNAAFQKEKIVIAEILCYQIKNLLIQHNSIEGYQSEKLYLLVRAFDIYNSVDSEFMPPRDIAQKDYIMRLLKNFFYQTETRIDNLQINVKQLQNNHAFFTPSKKEFNETIKPLIFSLRQDKSIAHLEEVKNKITDYMNKCKESQTQLKETIRLIDNYILSSQKLDSVSRPELQITSNVSLPRP